MSDIKRSFSDLIGNTPLYAAERFAQKAGAGANILAKLEYFNPAGSVKDRVACAMIDEAEASGALQPGATIIEPTSGNTGIGLAAVAAARGYRIILTMPETMSVERRNMLKAYGAELVLTEGAKGMAGAIAKANELAQRRSRTALSPASSTTRPIRRRTAPRPVRRSGRRPTVRWIFLSRVWARAARSPASAPISRSRTPQSGSSRWSRMNRRCCPPVKGGPHKIQGIGAGFVPAVLDTGDIRRGRARQGRGRILPPPAPLRTVRGCLSASPRARRCGRRPSWPRRPENAHKTIVALLPDTRRPVPVHPAGRRLNKQKARAVCITTGCRVFCFCK